MKKSFAEVAAEVDNRGAKKPVVAVLPLAGAAEAKEVALEP